MIAVTPVSRWNSGRNGTYLGTLYELFPHYLQKIQLILPSASISSRRLGVTTISNAFISLRMRLLAGQCCPIKSYFPQKVQPEDFVIGRL